MQSLSEVGHYCFDRIEKIQIEQPRTADYRAGAIEAYRDVLAMVVECVAARKEKTDG